MKNQKTISKVAFFTNATLLLASSAHAQAQMAGDNALETFQGALTGNIGLMIGLGIMVLGLLTWIFSGKMAAGITMILGGALFTLSPGIFNGVRDMLYGIVDQFSGGNATSVNSSSSLY